MRLVTTMPPAPPVPPAIMRATYFHDVRATTAEAVQLTWPELAERCAEPQTYPAKQDCPLVKLASFGVSRSPRGSLRHDANVVGVVGIEGDYDAEQMPPAVAAGLLTVAGIEAVVYTTPSHLPDKPRWRVVAPLSREYRPDARREFVGRLNAALGGILAPESFTLSQAYYMGRVAGVPFESFRVAGQPLDLVPGLTPVYPVSVPAQAQRTQDIAATPELIADIRAALAYLPADDYHDWVSTGQALVGLGDAGFELWAEWSSKSPKYDPDICEAKWGGFAGDRTGYAAVFAKAARVGWRNPRHAPLDPALAGFGLCPLPPGASLVPLPPAPPAVPRRFPFVRVADLLAGQKAARWLIRGWLEAGALALLFGESMAGKSFVALDWCARIVTGTAWNGCSVLAGPVFYICGEGHSGIGKRMAAWEEHHGIRLADAPLYVSERGASLMDLTEAEAIGETVRELSSQHGAPALVVVDTLHRNMGDGDENSAQDFGRFVTNIDRNIRLPLGCAVLLVHHCGLTSKDRSRGTGAIRGALDAEFSLQLAVDGMVEGSRNLTCIKQKDAEKPAPLVLVGQRVALPPPWTDSETGEALSSLVFVQSDAAPPLLSAVKQRVLPHGQRVALDALRKVSDQTPPCGAPSWVHKVASGDAWRAESYRMGLTTEPSASTDTKQKAFRRAVEALMKSGSVATLDGQYWENSAAWIPGQTGQDRTLPDMSGCPQMGV